MEDARALVLATRSAGKVRELRALCAAAGVIADDLAALGFPVDPAEGAIEVHDTFEANARAKARWFAARLPGRVVLAEDSGLEVDALGGAPGVQSKRWAGLTPSLTGAALDQANNDALIRALEGADDRRARYRCVAIIVDGSREIVSHGTSEGRMLLAPRGAGGFGYDPWFHSEELAMTFAQASAEAKSRVSHRGRAVGALLREWLDALGPELPVRCR